MNHAKLIFAVAAMGLSACAPQVQYGLLKESSAVAIDVGTFKRDSMLDTHFTKYYIHIGGNSVSHVTVCKDVQGNMVKAVATAPAEVSDSHFSVKTEVKTTEMLNNRPCVAKVEARTAAYAVREDQLFLTYENASPLAYGYRIGHHPSRLERLRRNARDLWVTTKAMTPDVVKNALIQIDEDIQETPAVVGKAVRYIGEHPSEGQMY